MSAPLYPDETGLPMTVWVAPRGQARRDARIVVNGVRGPRMTLVLPVVVAVAAVPRLISGKLPLVYERMVLAWVALNAEALADFWAGAVGVVGLGRRLRALPRTEGRRLARDARAEAQL